MVIYPDGKEWLNPERFYRNMLVAMPRIGEKCGDMVTEMRHEWLVCIYIYIYILVIGE